MKKITTTIVTFAFFGSSISLPLLRHISKEQIAITVTDKDRVGGNYSDSSKYLIFTQDEVFENTDELAYFKFNSSDIYRQLEIGKTYNVTVVGTRVPLFSWYRNIVDINSSK